MLSEIERLKQNASTYTILNRYKEIFSNPTILRELKHFAPAAVEQIKILDPEENRYNDDVVLPSTKNREIRALYALEILKRADYYADGDELLYTTLYYYAGKQRGSVHDYSNSYPIGIEIGIKDRYGNAYSYIAQGAIPVTKPNTDCEIIYLDAKFDKLTKEISLATVDGFATLSTIYRPNRNRRRSL